MIFKDLTMPKKNCRNRRKTYMCETRQLACFAKALGHPARIKILKFLSHAEFCYTGDFVKVLPLAQSTVSQHLKELNEAELIIAREIPPKTLYCINKRNWEKAKKLFEEFFDNSSISDREYNGND